MRTPQFSRALILRWVVLLLSVLSAGPAFAQDPVDLQALRGQYDTLMTDFGRIAESRGDRAALEQAQRGRAAMKSLTDEQLNELYSRTRMPDLSVVTVASKHLSRQADAMSRVGATNLIQAASDGFPEFAPIHPNCSGVGISGEDRYALLITKTVLDSVLAAATFVCATSVLGVNTSAACIPFSVAASVAGGFYDTAVWCAGEVTGGQVDANFQRIDHIHNDLGAAITIIVDAGNANTSSILANAATNTTAIVTKANANKDIIVANDNTNTATIITNANANKNELRDLVLRTQIEADLAMADSSAVVISYLLPAVQGGYINLVGAIVTETIADVLAAGRTLSNATSALTAANAAKGAGDFKTAYALYRKAFKAAQR
jgi:hypothetical protein